MAVELDVELVSPEEVTYSGSAEMVIVRTAEEGDIAFQAGHVPFLGVLAPWSVDVLRPGRRAGHIRRAPWASWRSATTG